MAADVIKAASSPWDEPLDEKKAPEKPKPTVVGDLDFGIKNNQSATPPRLAGLKVPTDVDEKVGAKVDAKSVVAPQGEAPVKLAAKTAPQGEADFWQSVYGQAAEKPTPPTSIPAARKEAPKMENIPPAAPQGGAAGDIRPPTATPSPTAAQPVVASQVAAVPTPAPKPQPPAINQPAPTPIKPTPTTASQPTPTAPRKSKTKVAALAIIFGLLVLFAGGIFLTEEGMISIGLEKVYGFLHLETLWHGLPADPEAAFALAASKMKTAGSFKVAGDATLTVSQGVKSNIISPIIASDSSTAGSTSQTSTSTSPASTIASVQELTAQISAGVSEGISGATIDLKSKKSLSSKIDLVYSSGKLYVKTSDDIVYNEGVKGGWISYDLKNFSQDTLVEKFFGSDFSASNFSMTGSRVGDETTGGVRCFHYSSQVTVGDALKTFGLSGKSIQSADVDFWLGTSDHLIHKVQAKIIPGSSSAVSRLEINLEFSDFGNGGGNYLVPATSTPASTPSATPTPGQAATATSEALRDSQRKSDLASIAKALESYYAVNKKYPTSTKTEKITQTGGVLGSALVPRYITSLPIDPLDPTYYYGYESDGKSYTLSAILEDKNDKDGKTVGSKYLYFLKSQ